MRALVTRSIRPRIGTTSTSSITFPSATSPVRQAVFPPARRKLTFSDAFTILLAPVFAAAFVADTTLKERRRKAWEEKIAEIREEIEAIRERELQSWEAVQLRSVQVGAIHQRRGYTTAARAMKSEITPESEMGETYSQQKVGRSRDDIDLTKQEGASKQNRRQEILFDPQVIANWQQYESLLASKLALELLLHIRTGKSWLYRQPTEILVDPDLFPESLDGLMAQLHRVNDALKQINSKKRPGEVPRRLLLIPGRDLLHENIANLATACKEGKITVAELVYGYAKAIGGSKTAPKSTSYRALMDAFLTLDNESLAYTTMGALQNCQQRLHNADIGTMVFQYGHFKDGGRFTGFLRLLVKKEASCILRLVTPWEHVIVNDVRVPTPMDRDTWLIATSIKAALQCGMVQYAEAWTALLFQTGNREQLGSVMRHIITYYTEHYDWTYGSKWLREIIKRIALIADENAEELSKCIMRMLELCVACDKSSMYERIMEAVVIANVRPEPINYSRPEFFSDRILSIRRDWVTRQKKASALEDNPESSEDNHVEQAVQFQQVLVKNDPTLGPYIGITSGAEMVAATTSAEAKDPSQSQTRPFHSPAELLGGEGSITKQREALNAPQRGDKETIDQQRIIELQNQLAETQKRSAELLKQLKSQAKKAQELNTGHPKPGKPGNSLSHLHLLADHQKLLEDFTDLQIAHKTILDTHETQQPRSQQKALPRSSQYRTTNSSPRQVNAVQAIQGRQVSIKKPPRSQFRSFHAPVQS